MCPRTQLPGDQISDQSIDTADIADNAVTNTELSADVLSLGKITNSKLTIDADGVGVETVILNNATGNEVALTLNYTTNKATSGNDTGLVINQTDTLSPGISNLLDLQVSGISKFRVKNDGLTFCEELSTSGGQIHLCASNWAEQAKLVGISGKLYIYTSGGAGFIEVDATGRVCIGSTDPSEKLDVRGNLQLNKNELKQAVIEKLSSEPGSPVEGQVFFNTTTKQLMLYNGTSFVILG